jgi:hypothetical protein
MANELAPGRAYIDAYEAMQLGRQRAAAEAQAAEMARLNEARRQAATAAMKEGMIDPLAYGNQLARAGFAYAVPGAQKELYELEEQRGKGMQSIGKGVQERQSGIDAILATSRDTLARVTDQPGWDSWRSQLVTEFPDFDPIIPVEYSPENKSNSLMTADLLTKELEQVDLNDTVAFVNPMTGEEAGPRLTKGVSREKASEYNPEIKEVEDPNDPSQILLVDVKRWRGGGIGSPGVIGPKGKAPVEKGEKSGDAFISVIEEMETNYDELNRMGAIPSTKRSAQENLKISAQTSDLGQMLGRATGTKAQSLRNQVQSARLRLLQGIKAATGMSAQELNSNVELQQWLDAVTNPANDYESNRAILKSIRQFVEDNKPGKRMAPAAERPAAGVSASERQKAMDWLKKNPKHPRAAEVRKKLGV